METPGKFLKGSYLKRPEVSHLASEVPSQMQPTLKGKTAPKWEDVLSFEMIGKPSTSVISVFCS